MKSRHCAKSTDPLIPRTFLLFREIRTSAIQIIHESFRVLQMVIFSHSERTCCVPSQRSNGQPRLNQCLADGPQTFSSFSCHGKSVNSHDLSVDLTERIGFSHCTCYSAVVAGTPNCQLENLSFGRVPSQARLSCMQHTGPAPTRPQPVQPAAHPLVGTASTIHRLNGN